MSSLRDTTRTTRPGVRSWGAFPSATTLPNTEFGPVTGELFPGDLAVVAGVLYRCTDSTVGSAAWEQIPTMADVGGDVSGPGSSTDNAIVRWDGTDGTTIQNSTAILSDTGLLTGVQQMELGTSGGLSNPQLAMYYGANGGGAFLYSIVEGELILSVSNGIDPGDTVEFHANAGSPRIQPTLDSTWDIGSPARHFLTGYFDTLVADVADISTRINVGASNELDVEEDYFRYEPRTSGVGVDSYLRSQSGSPAESAGADGNPAGDLYIEAGDGTAGGASGPTDGGDGGTLYLRAGDGGASVGEAVTDGQGGDVIIDAGNGGGGDSTDGVVTVGATNAYSVAIGKSDGALGFFGATPVVRSAAYTPTNVTPDRSFNADTVAVAELADIVGTMIADLQNLGIFQ